MLTLRDYAPEARSILCDNVKRVCVWNDEDETSRLFNAGVLSDGHTTTLDAAPVEFARAVAAFVESLGYAASVAVAAQFQIGVDDSKLFVLPVSTNVETVARDVIKETCACQVFLIDHVGSDSVDATNRAFDTATTIQREILDGDAGLLWRIESATIYGDTNIGTGARVDGLFDSGDLEERFVVKSPLVVVGARYLQRS